MDEYIERQIIASIVLHVEEFRSTQQEYSRVYKHCVKCHQRLIKSDLSLHTLIFIYGGKIREYITLCKN